MAKRGRKPFTSEQLKLHGAPLNKVVARQKQEARQGKVVLLAQPGKTTPKRLRIPPEITAPAAIDVYAHVMREYECEAIAESLLREAILALQRSIQARETIAREGMVDHRGTKALGHPLLGVERDAKLTYLRLMKALKLLE